MPHLTATDLATAPAAAVSIAVPITVPTDRTANRPGTASLQTGAP